MSDDFIKSPNDPRTGEQFAKDKAAEAEVISNILKPMFKTEAADELMKLMKIRNDIRHRVFATLKPIIGAALMRQPNDPIYAHTESGRATLLITAHKLYLDELVKFNRDESLFLLALMYAERTLEDLV